MKKEKVVKATSTKKATPIEKTATKRATPKKVASKNVKIGKTSIPSDWVEKTKVSKEEEKILDSIDASFLLKSEKGTFSINIGGKLKGKELSERIISCFSLTMKEDIFFKKLINKVYELGNESNKEEIIELENSKKAAYLNKNGIFKVNINESKYCLHCGKKIRVKDFKIRKYNNLGEKVELITCPNAPKCDGTMMDWVDSLI